MGKQSLGAGGNRQPLNPASQEYYWLEGCKL